MKKEEWTRQLRDQMADYQEAVPEGLWEEIASALPEVSQGRARTVRLRRWIAAAVIAGLLALGPAYYFLTRQQPAATRPVSGTAHVASAQRGNSQAASSPEAEKTGVEDSQVLLSQVRSATLSSALSVVDGAGQSDIIRQEEEPVAPVQSEKAPDTSAPVEQTTRKLPIDVPPATKNTSPAGSYNRPAAQKRSRENDSRWSAGLLASNVFSADMNNQVETEQVMMSAAKSHRMEENTAYTTFANAEPVYLAGYEEKTEHRQPVTYGLTLRYRIDSRWAVESGVVYSKLRSDFTKKMRRHEQVDRQTLHYVGIPLNVSCRVWDSRWVSTYLSAGGEVDKNVSARLETEGTSMSLPKDRLQFSAGAAAGVQVNVVPRLGVYVEPGVKYYFDNKSNMDNIFKDKKLNFSLQFGLRYDVK